MTWVPVYTKFALPLVYIGLNTDHLKVPKNLINIKKLFVNVGIVFKI